MRWSRCYVEGINLIIILALLLIPATSIAQEGEKLFRDNCAVCHQLGGRLIGPDLTGINARLDEDWLIKFIQSSQSMIRSGDREANAIYEQFSRIAMPDHPNLTDADVRAILGYIKNFSAQHQVAAASSASNEQDNLSEPVVYTREDISNGRLLFTGKKSLANGGPSCIVCHNVTNNDIISGGRLAKDLTEVYSRIGDNGIRAILTTPPFPAMAQAFKNHPVNEEEAHQLAAFFNYSDQVSNFQRSDTGNAVFLNGGIAGMAFLLGLIALFWKRRKKLSVKNEIYNRQLKSI